MKKYLYSALALPLLFACSSEDFTEQEVISNDQFAGIEKVDATFTMDEGAITRMDNGSWNPQEGDLWGFAWMGDGGLVPTDGKAYQNHNLIQKGTYFEPQTSIYVGKYYLYRPYDKTTVTPQAINFKSLEGQTLTEGYASTTDAWKNLAKTAINIGDQWIDVTADGWADAAGKRWDKAGIKQSYKLYAAMFSNQTGLDLTYVKNNPSFTAATAIAGATDINLTYAAGEPVGAADIYGVTVDLDGSAKSFTYAPTATPTAAHVDGGTYWADKSNLGAGDGFTFTDDVITLTPANATTGISTGDNGSKAWFWFNSLPVTAGDGAAGTAVQTVLNTSYGVVTVNSTVGACAYVFDKYDNAATSTEWIKLAAADNNTVTPKTWNLAGAHNTFVNQYGNHKGKYALNVDFSTGVMNNMHIKNDAHLQKLLKYYIASGKNENVVLNLDGASATDKTFKISKISIALLQSIPGNKVKVQACGTHNNPVKIIVTQDGQTGELADKTEVPALNGVFNTPTDVYLASNTTWTWKERTGTNQLPIDANVTSITNEGTLTVNASNLQLSVATSTLKNAVGATMNITKVTTVKNALTNLGTINVGSASDTDPELRAYGVAITNDATALNASGTINNYGVVGVTAGVIGGEFNNYGVIDMKSDAAITLLTTNELVSNFDDHFAAATNKMGTVILPNGQPNALVSVSNGAETGFIKYNWTGANYVTPNNGTVKYNTIVVSDNITFTSVEDEIKYIEFNGTRTQVTNPCVMPGYVGNKLTSLKGVIINAGKSIIIEKNNGLNCSDGAFLGAGATVYKGGEFTHNANVVGTTASNYFGDWDLTQIIEY